MFMNRSKRILNPANEFRYYFSSKAKTINYYETLKVTPKSTQDDIKTAYYELSKKYHPDVNKSPDAKKMFQNVSDAYEVLGNFNKRRLYDRDLLARGVGHRRTQTFTDVEEDPLAGFYKSRHQQSEYDPHRDSATNQAKFDFDRWTHAHYGNSLRRTLKNSNAKVLRQKLKMEYEREKQTSKTNAITVLGTLLTIMTILSIYAHHAQRSLDRNLISKKEK